MSDFPYTFRFCLNEGCGLRFPAPSATPASDRCPRCGHTTQLATTPERHWVPKTTPPTHTLHGVLLDNIRSLHNVGSILRTLDSAGGLTAYLGGITPSPDNPKLAKSALGAESVVPWHYHPNGAQLAAELVGQGFVLWGVEGGPRAEPLWPLPEPPPSRVVLVVGHEVVGIDPAILSLCERVFYLPQGGQNFSMNVAVACGVALYALQFGAQLKEF